MRPRKLAFPGLRLFRPLQVRDKVSVEDVTEGAVAQVVQQGSNSDITNLSLCDILLGVVALQDFHLGAGQVRRAYAVLEARVGP